MKIKKGDNIIVITGKDKGKTGKVLRALPALNMVIVDGVNKRKKHQRPSRSNQKGQVVEKMMPVNVSNVMIVDPTSGKPTRVGKKLVGDKMVRISRKSGATL
jgi:large subunit ribosomal protein L24